jgi:release factor glutamine methyltransferase
MRRLGEVLRLSTAYLEATGSPTARLDAELLLAHALALTRVQLYTEHDRPLTERELEACREAVGRRGRREPVAYVLGRWGFRGLDLLVDRRVLVPRPETEVVVDRCLALLAGIDAPRVVDVGTGSGAIALAIAQELPGARVTACDVSEDALAVASANRDRAGLAVELVRSDLLAAFHGRSFDLVVANLPYVATTEVAGLAPEVAHYEPRGAVVAGDRGTEAMERLVAEAQAHLEPGGAIVLEVGAGQAGALAGLLTAAGYEAPQSEPDLASVERVVWARRP